MTKKWMKYVSLMMCLGIIVSVAVACSSEDTIPEEVPETAVLAGTEETTDIRKQAVSYVPETLTFQGEQFTLLQRSEDPYCDEFSGDNNGEILSDALYNRNLLVEEQLDVTMVWEKTIGNWPNGNEYITKIRNIVTSGDDGYHAFAGYAGALNSVGAEGLFLNFHEIPYLHLDAPWWNQSISRELTLYDSLYFLAGEMTTSLLGNSIVFFFNKDIAEQNNLPDLYQLVVDKQWTVDTWLSLCETVSEDSNGDGIYDDKDHYGVGLPLNSQIDAFHAGCDIPITGINEEGRLVIKADVEKMLTVLEKLNTLIYSSHAAYAPPSFDDQTSHDIRQMFTEGMYLFHPNTVSSVTTDGMRDMTDDFGILPYPMYNETQEHYKTYAWDQYSLLCIPRTSTAVDMSGAVLESLATETYRSVTTIYFEDVLKNKHSRDNDSFAMLDIIVSSIDINFGYLNLNIIYQFREHIKANSSDIASWFAANEIRCQEELNKTMENYMQTIS